jgi:hypothetical protein
MSGVHDHIVMQVGQLLAEVDGINSQATQEGVDDGGVDRNLHFKAVFQITLPAINKGFFGPKPLT